MSQMTSFVIALNACWNVSVFVTTVMDKPQNAHAPTGRGVRTRPVIVLRKMASNVHARGSTAAGQGTRNLITNPTATDAHAAPIFAPFHTNPGAAGEARARVPEGREATRRRGSGGRQRLGTTTTATRRTSGDEKTAARFEAKPGTSERTTIGDASRVERTHRRGSAGRARARRGAPPSKRRIERAWRTSRADEQCAMRVRSSL